MPLYAANATTFYNFIFLSLYCMKLSQMQALKGQKGGFTLVELIVVITILAILATVGFLSYQNYTKDAKSAKVRENVGLLVNAMNTKGASAIDMTTLINTGSEDRTVTLSGSKTVFGIATGSLMTIKAGDVQWSAISGVAQADMKDVNDSGEPLVGYASTATNSALQIASTIKVGDVDTIYVKGNFTADTSSGALGLIAATGSVTELVDGTAGDHRTY